MPRYYIDRRIDGALEVDTDGVELADEAEACRYVLDALSNVLRAQLGAGDYRPFSMAARDGAGRVIYRMKLALEEETVDRRRRHDPGRRRCKH